MIYVDSNVLIDILDADPDWRDWSAQQIEDASLIGRLVSGATVAAEIGHFSESTEQLEHWFDVLGVELLASDFKAAFLAGQAYRVYRERGGPRRSLLADFLIGSHALALDATLLTRDPRWYRRYFPDLNLICPKEVTK
ncbi:MAG: DNA-binding protein [Erythrobacter sp.]|nr:DNA-binding protein [Erythrobacter sp.]